MVKEDVVLHIGKFEGAPFKEGSAVECHISEEVRRIHARVHSAGHLLDIAMNKAGRSDLKPGKGFHQPVGAYVEYIGNVEAKDREPLLKLMNEHCKEIITKTPKDKMVYKKICEYDEAQAQLAKAGGVPDYIPKGNSLRVLKLIEDDYGCPCGGTHVEHVSDIAEINITKL